MCIFVARMAPHATAMLRTKPMINVFHIVSNKHWTGAEQYTYDLVERLRNDDDFYVEVVCRKYPVVLKQYRRLEIPISILHACCARARTSSTCTVSRMPSWP